MTARVPSGRGGFTLVELAIVAVILALLAAIAIPNLQRAVLRARATDVVGQLHVVRVAVLNYLTDHHTFPPDADRGAPPPELEPYLPEGFSFTKEDYLLDYDDWTSFQGFVGVRIITEDQDLGRAVIEALGTNAWSSHPSSVTLVIEWTG